jgi:hypothetical protein
MPTQPHHLCICYSSQKRMIFKQCFRNPGCRNSQKYHFKCMLDLQGKRSTQPIQRQGSSILFPFTTTLQIIRKQRSQTKTAKSHPPLRHSRNCKTKRHRIAASSWTAHHPCNLLRHAIMQITQSHPGRETTDQDPPPPQPPFLQKRKTS